MARNKILSTLVLYPLSKLFGIGVELRNLLFKWHILKQHIFPVPVIVVGNIAVGGTGKTPHAEYIIGLLKTRYHVGVLSRGYRRSTKGYIPVTDRSTPLDVGDEPYQMFHKYSGDDTFFAVCEDRCKGIRRMLADDNKIDLIVLDDAYQHRYVKPTVSIVLTEFNRPAFFDHLMPYGRLREPAYALERAEIVVVTKCPEKLKPLEYRIFKNNLKLFHYQKLFFSRFVYREPVPLFPNDAMSRPSMPYLGADTTILAIPGIANPRPFVNYLKRFRANVKVKVYPDHHNFSRKDLEMIASRFKSIDAPNKFIITTEKDAVRLLNNPYFPIELRPYIFFIPIVVEFESQNGETFDQTLLTLVRNSTLSVERKSKTNDV